MPQRKIDSLDTDGADIVASLLARIDQLLAQIAALNARIAELEGKAATLSSPTTRATARCGPR